MTKLLKTLNPNLRISNVRKNHCLTNKMFFDYHVASFASTDSKTRQSDAANTEYVTTVRYPHY